MEGNTQDIRWKQRLQNYNKALMIVQNAIELASTRELSDLEKQGLIQGFEFTFELAWNVMKDYLEEQGIFGLSGNRDTIRCANKNNLIENGQIWMDMIIERNLASHTYDEETANDLYAAIVNKYYYQFKKFAEKMESLTNS